MKQLIKKHWHKAIGVIVLGAVGSGLWEYILKPGLFSLTGLALNIATLGMERFKNDLYEEIARGFHEGPSLTLLMLFFGVLSGFAFGVITSKYVRGLKDRNEGFKRRFTKFAVIYSLFIITFLLVMSSRITYINRAITHFSQLNLIVAPYISEEEQEIILSRFSQVHSKADYESVLSDLQVIAKEHNLHVPDFSIW
jgi:F0F1-type ATP synthase membrane subunit c/vacuolar-type H+-ATPase subunit K